MTKVLRTWLGDALLPCARAWIRYSPFLLGKAWLWEIFQWRHHAFSTRLKFGYRVSGNTRDLIQRHLYFFGVWEPQISHWIRSTLRAGDGFIDIGANIGYYSLLASKIVGGTGVVVAVEASPQIHLSLARHIELNRRRNVRAVQAAAMAKRSTVRLFLGRDDNIGKTSTISSNSESIEVSALPMTDVLLENEIQCARIIKIDVEGAELQVLQGLAPLFPLMRPDLEVVMEISPSAATDASSSADQIFSIMGAHGFSARKFDNDYRVGSYLRTTARVSPQSITAADVQSQTDVLFSRAAPA